MISSSLRRSIINQCFPTCFSTFISPRSQSLKLCPASPTSISSNSLPRKMGSTQILKEALETLNLQTPAPNPHKFPDFYPEYNPLDIYRAHLADILSGVTGVAAGNIYPCIQWTQTLGKGDLVLPVPALRVKGGKPTDLAHTWAKEVNFTPYFGNAYAMLITLWLGGC